MVHGAIKRDIVARRSYHDIFFKVMEVLFEDRAAIAILKGLDVRLLADAPCLI